MQINSSQLTTTHAAANATSRVEVNKSVASNQTSALASGAIEASGLIKAQQSFTINDYQEDELALQSRLGAHVEYENHTGGHRGAVAEYLVNQHAAKREEIKQMVGIDTYA
ncbi:conserved hypothetical protein [Shewanella halifaxensis HAW-EB4]|uniref:Uncharacterized protein n=1 Tax=Shewanella halifaxensis (strain HAW-EB4) TaxID=458817 RepID=B0TRH5_SHEHH|nr:hypothetical protein [Shewanella halifaxensis]ABZ76393.1 conserved hypothetical protein [Shewanella halifaxensis HAW-EB4]